MIWKYLGRETHAYVQSRDFSVLAVIAQRDVGMEMPGAVYMYTDQDVGFEGI